MSESHSKIRQLLPCPVSRQPISFANGLSQALLCAVFLLSVLVAGNPAQADITIIEKIKIYGDFRARLESDFDSQRSNGVDRNDRTRARIRARVGLKFEPKDYLMFNFRLRSGSDDSHQSPHITVVDFDDNDTGDADFNPDKWYLQAKTKNVWGWIGRNGLPIWKQNELFWDDDVTPAGIAGGLNFDLGGGKVAVNGGYFSLPVGMQEFSGNLAMGQIVLSGPVGPAGITLAGGVFEFDSETDDPDGAMLLNGNGTRDYTIWTGSFQAKFKLSNEVMP